MSKDSSPWSQPDPRWQPQSYSDQRGRDPRQPFGSGPTDPPQRPTSIEDFTAQGPPRRPWWLIVGAAVAVVVLAVVIWQVVSPGGTEGDPQATASPNVTSLPHPSQSVPGSSATGGNSIPFEGNGNGLFEILSEDWDSSGVDISFRVSIESGQEGFVVYMFNNESMEVTDPLDPYIFTVTGNEPFTGEVRFKASRGSGTLVLANALGRALTALPIKG